jgi:hypothetical protein
MGEEKILETPNAAEKKPVPAAEGEDVSNWDEYLPTPPPRRKGRIVVQLRYRGRSKPIPVENPSESAVPAPATAPTYPTCPAAWRPG